MQRRRFLQLSGFSAASLLLTKINPLSGQSYQTLIHPDVISVLSSGNWLPLTRIGDQWIFQNISIFLDPTADGTAIQLKAPGREIEKIKLSWKQASPADARYLGDQWERSYGDLAWESASSKRKAPWYLLIHNGMETHAFGVKTGANSICYWQADRQKLELFLDTHSGGMGFIPGERTLHAAEILTTKSLTGESPYQTDIRFCKMMCANPVLPEKPVYGINDWYFAYGNNSKELILEHTRLMASLAQDSSNRPFSVVDDGWSLHLDKDKGACCQGDDYSKPNAKFGDMSVVASEIKNMGMRPGLWTRPLLANKNDALTALIPIRKEDKNPKDRYIDPTIPENLQRVHEVISLYTTWGYELVKHDYTTFDFFGRWGFEMNEEMTSPGWHFNDRSKTNAEIILELYRTIRRAAGKMVLLGCNTLSHLSAGLFELNRIGDDTSGKEWARTVKMGVNTLGFRLPQHNAFYAADGDCVGLTTNIPWKENKQWLQLLAESSAPLFISAQPEALGAEQKQAIKKSFEMAANRQPLGEPLDWLTNPRPVCWKLNGRTVNFDWS